MRPSVEPVGEGSLNLLVAVALAGRQASQLPSPPNRKLKEVMLGPLRSYPYRCPSTCS